MIEADTSLVCQLIETKVQADRRTIVAIAGPPASGKSTLADSVVRRLNLATPDTPPRAALLPMDGYHLDNRLLDSMGLRHRKGSPETFDAEGFCDAVKRLEFASRVAIHPIFDRQLDLAVANAISIHPQTPIVVVEGNYLLLKQKPWSDLQDAFSASVFVCPPMAEIKERLLQRWITHGFSQDMAAQKVAVNDLPNAELVASQSWKADLTLTQNYTEPDATFAH